MPPFFIFSFTICLIRASYLLKGDYSLDGCLKSPCRILYETNRRIILDYRNASTAFADISSDIIKFGDNVEVRGQKTKEMIQIGFNIHNPAERFSVIKYRNGNPFALIAETFWVLAGRNDIHWLLRYLPRAGDFSDDGETWRAGYGKRIIDFNGINQLQFVYDELMRNTCSRRAIINIWDPTLDFVDSKDIPCNISLHFMIRNEMLYMSVFQRSQDLIWGYSINLFEWSVFHEALAVWLGVDVGVLSYLVGSAHIYERHFERVENINNWVLNSGDNFDIYDRGYTNAPIVHDREGFNYFISEFFYHESSWRGGVFNYLPELKNDFLSQASYMIYLYNLMLTGKTSPSELEYLVKQIPPEYDISPVALEFFERKGYGGKK